MWHTKENTPTGSGLTGAANTVLRVIGAAILAVLTLLSMGCTQYMMPGEAEKMINVRDNIFANLVFPAGIVGLGCVLQSVGNRLTDAVKKRISVMTLLAAMLSVAVQSFRWIWSADRVPVGDQAYIYGGASYFSEGNYAFLTEGAYCSMFPYQLGLIALVEFLFVFAGAYNYLAFEVVCAVMAVAIVGIGYLILKEMTESLFAAVLYNALMAICLPLIFYTSWVYGDLPGTFFMLLCTWALLRLGKSKRKLWIPVAALSMMLAVLVRMNSIIFLVAVCIVGILGALQYRNGRLMIAVILAVILPFMAYQGVYKFYENRSGIEHSGGIPFWATIAMGLQESGSGNGWCNDYHKNTYRDCGLDRALTAETAKKDIAERLKEFSNDPAYAAAFMGRKLASQWNAPLYQSLYFNGDYPDENWKTRDSAAYRMAHEDFHVALTLADRLQFVVYMGTLLYFIFAVRRDSGILQHILAVTVVGGFLFSMLWEAKARYSFPYYIVMFPMAAVGYQRLYCAVRQFYAKVRACFLKKNKV